MYGRRLVHCHSLQVTDRPLIGSHTEGVPSVELGSCSVYQGTWRRDSSAYIEHKADEAEKAGKAEPIPPHTQPWSSHNNGTPSVASGDSGAIWPYLSPLHKP
jgi:hypothetical protein